MSDLKDKLEILKFNMRFGLEDCECCRKWTEKIDEILEEEKGE